MDATWKDKLNFHRQFLHLSFKDCIVLVEIGSDKALEMNKAEKTWSKNWSCYSVSKWISQCSMVIG